MSVFVTHVDKYHAFCLAECMDVIKKYGHWLRRLLNELQLIICLCYCNSKVKYLFKVK